ncbi:peroxiredoxin-like family protein [Chryseolinea lacunae]|uniref:AhpC/TSA family protein n=1 Tax=Chryseolinea lacunae TaxID=2801331 RepID=A0ABS1KXE2_9BACT|nr:peroxiredoxin-like family protein [Chryseolinea lacunae]MBL0742971.1 AhpC/TSA family protein [Chryseolinea lacunae]
MKLIQNQTAPALRVVDVNGKIIDLQSLRGQKVYLSFERNAGCPVCNLRTHDLLNHASLFRDNQVVVAMVYESPVARMKEYLGDKTYPFHFISDPDNMLYNTYGVERSLLKMMRSLGNGLLDKVKRGKKLFEKEFKQDGNATRIPAEFIIDEAGKIKMAHYGKFVGDHVPLETLKQIITR